jgi:hypothetical protein
LSLHVITDGLVDYSSATLRHGPSIVRDAHADGDAWMADLWACVRELRVRMLELVELGAETASACERHVVGGAISWTSPAEPACRTAAHPPEIKLVDPPADARLGEAAERAQLSVAVSTEALA